jgi:hypothetical protein
MKRRTSGRTIVRNAVLLGVSLTAVGITRLAAAQGLPPGFTCGLSNAYSQNGGFSWFANLHSCAADGDGPIPPVTLISTAFGASTFTSNLNHFTTVTDGDGGDSPGWGFFHFSYNQPNPTPPDLYRLPKGTACGFKEAAYSNPSTTCMGVNPQTGCNMPGWQQKFRNDAGGPGGTGRFVWCEYQDPHGLCTSASCYHDSVPVGTVCGASDTQKVGTSGGGQCMGLPPSPYNCGVLGYSYYAWDSNAPSGQGLGYCIKDQ